MQTFDAYIRVSRVNGREGDGFISPDVQRERIEEWAAREGVQITMWHEELDKSGGRMDRPKLRAAIERVKRGETDGIVVAKRDRFARSLLGAVSAIGEIEAAGGVFAAADGLNTATPEGKLGVNFMMSLAEFELDRIRDGWNAATRRAVEDGVHIASKPPTGYRRENGKRSRLVPDPDAAPLIREVFLRRAQRESWGALAQFLQEHGVRASKNGVRGIVRNRAYLGEARGPNGAVNPKAHEPLVSQDEWEAAQWEGRTYAKDGTHAAEGVLSGLLTCAGCGHRLAVTMSTQPKTGERIPIYFCKGRYADGRCDERPAAQVRVVDQYVRDAFAVALFDGTLATTMDAVERYARAEAAVRQAERELDELADLDLRRQLGKERHDVMVAQARERLEEVKRVLRETPRPGEAVVPTSDVFGPEWPTECQRALARQFIAKVTLRRGGKGRWSPPVAERMEITWAGHDAPDAKLAERVNQLRADMEPVDRLVAA